MGRRYDRDGWHVRAVEYGPRKNAEGFEVKVTWRRDVIAREPLGPSPFPDAKLKSVVERFEPVEEVEVYAFAAAADAYAHALSLAEHIRQN